MHRTSRCSVAVLLALAIPLCACAEEKPAAKPDAAKTPAGGEEAAAPREMSWTGVLSEEEFQALHELKPEQGLQLHGEKIDLADGRAYLSLPDGEPPFPGIVVIQEWWGLNENIEHWSDRLAAEGYAAIAVDLYDGTVAKTPEEALATMQSVQDDRAYEILDAAFDFLADDPRVQAEKRGCIGWCFGGGWSLRMAIAEPDLDAAVIYYGRLVDDPAELGKIRAKLCCIFGNRDQGIPPDAVDAFESGLKAAKVDHEIHRYDANHAFANPSGARYDFESAEAAWRVVRSFLEQNLKE
jgi:carboxymethylenebutenolidase